jgi:long-chain acyl-CoA synthetase
VAGYYDAFEETVRRHPSRTAIELQRRDGTERYTYARLARMAGSVSEDLRALGLAPGAPCAILADNGAPWCAAYLAVLRLGAVAVPLDTTYSPTQVARILRDSGAGVLVSSARHDGTATAALQVLGAGCARLGLPDEPGTGGDRPAEPEPRSHDDLAVVLYTSGTTSDPKGVMLTHGNLLAEIELAVKVVTLGPEDAVLGVLPLFHALAQVANLLLPFSLGARVVFLETVNTGELLRALHEREITAFCCVPQFFYLVHERLMEQVASRGRARRLAFRLLLACAGLVRERTGLNPGPVLFRRLHGALGRHMRLLVTGGSRFDPAIGRDFYRLGFNILQAYGLTECAGAATVLRPGDPHVDSVGQALPGVDLKILPAAEGGSDGVEGLPPGTRVGEIAIRGPVVSPGYFRRPDASAATFREGWLHSGDLGYLDRQGRLYVTGRAKEVIVLGSGKNVYPEEVEAHYLTAPSIAELCVMGRSTPGKPASERLHAVIVPDFESLRARKIVNAREILRWEIENLSAGLPGYKRILSYDVVSRPLPRTTTRKLKRFEIERRATQADARGETSASAAAAWPDDPFIAAALDLVRRRTGAGAALSPGANLELDLGLDSMERVELIAALEARFGGTLPERSAHTVHTLGELLEAVRPTDGTGTGTGPAVDPWEHLLDPAESDDPTVEAALRRRPWLQSALWAAARALSFAARLLLGLRVSGREHLPTAGPFIVSPNHQSFLDAFLLVGTLPYRVFAQVFYVGASEYFETPLRRRLARALHVVPVDPDTNLVRAMRAGARGLGAGRVLILFPEGERSIDGRVKAFKKGAAILSLHTGAPIVPVALEGLFEIWPRGHGPRWRNLLPGVGRRVQVRFGRALEPSGSNRPDERAYTELTARLRDSVDGMMSPRAVAD